MLLEVSESDDKTMTPQRLKAYSRVLSFGSTRSSKMAGFGAVMMSLLPSPVKNAVEKWSSCSVNEFPPMYAWVSLCVCVCIQVCVCVCVREMCDVTDTNV